jgi:uncharacterized cupin superfamily protein
MPVIRPIDQHIERIEQVDKAGDPLAHALCNKSAAPAKVLVVGTRAHRDRITYPEHDRQLLRDRSQPEDVWTDLQGNPASNPYAA